MIAIGLIVIWSLSLFLVGFGAGCSVADRSRADLGRKTARDYFLE